jgi:hypothetical protein
MSFLGGPGPQRRDDVPEGFDPVGVPRPGAGRDALVMVLSLIIALLGLIATVMYVVYYHLHRP